MTGIYAIINTLEPLNVPYGPACPIPLAAIAHRSYIGKAKDFERRWRDDHVRYLLNGQHACTPLLDAFQAWLRANADRLELLAQSKRTFKSTWLGRATEGQNPEWRLGPFVFRVLEEVPLERLIEREEAYHAANPGGYRGGANDGRRWKKWDGK
jgi:hypothetical protein